MRIPSLSCHHRRVSAATLRRAACCGQGTVEFLLAAVPVLLLGLGGIEAVHWYFSRQAVSLALMQAGRAAITQQADPVTLDQAFTQALLPLYAAPSPSESRARLQRAMRRRTEATALPAWRIRIVSPSVAAFHDFASDAPELRHDTGLPAIDNDYLHEQHQARLAQGWPQGRGPQSRRTTLEANRLVLRLTWLHEPLLPGVRQLMRQLAPPDARYGSLAMQRGGFLPIHREITLVMQSHAALWPMPAHGRVTHLAGLTGTPETELAAEDARAAPAAIPPGTDQGSGSGQHGGTTDSTAQYPMSSQPGPDIHSEPGEPGRAGGLDGANGARTEAQAMAGSCMGLWCLDAHAGGGNSGNPEGASSAAPPGSANGNDTLTNGPATSDEGGSFFDPDSCPGCCE